VSDAELRTSAARALRVLLLWVVPLALVATLVSLYMAGRRYVSTDNAYVKADHATVAAEVSGTVTAVLVRENDAVTTGTPLVELDASARRIEVQRAAARVDLARGSIIALRATLREKRSALAVARQDGIFAERELERLRVLAERRLVAQTGRDAADRAAVAARGRVEVLTREVEQIQAQLGEAETGDPDRHPEVAAALADLARARLDESHTRLLAPRPGIVARVPHVGDRLEVGKPALAIVANEQPWVEANFKETDLEFMRVGQPVRIEVDAYSGHRWSGRIQSIAQATGAEFAVIPAQNASGNWVKVVQRVPVRIALQAGADDPPLRSGMSAAVRVDTGRETGIGAVLAGDAKK
jgi:membrane fusion protein (multidrug efflux system)